MSLSFILDNSENSEKDQIRARFKQLYPTVDELKKIFHSLLPKKSLLRELIDFKDIKNSDVMCEILLEYIGDHFLVHVGTQLPDEDNGKRSENDPLFILREDLLNRACQVYENPDTARNSTLFNFSCSGGNEYDSIHDMVRDRWFLRKKWRTILCEKILLMPESIAISPEKLPQEQETVSLTHRPVLNRLYDFQIQSLMKIHELLSEKYSEPDRQKRLLINVPTGAGKTRLTVQSLVEWLNLRAEKRIPNSHEQQQKGRIIFWFASTNELCSQAAGEFEYIFSQIGSAPQVNLTRLYGDKRRSLLDILNDRPGVHIVVTNTKHFEEYLRNEAIESRFYVDQYRESTLFKYIREQTIAIVVDEAHEITSKTYQQFLGAMGFDYSGRKESFGNINTNNILLLGLTATAYKGSGIDVNQRTDDEFLSFDEKRDPPYYKKLDLRTKKIHKTFGGVFVPLPRNEQKKSNPTAVIDSPVSAYAEDPVKISGVHSFDNNSKITFLWSISSFDTKKINSTDETFYHKFKQHGTFLIKLTVTNEDQISATSSQKITIFPEPKDKRKRTGDLTDNKEFYSLLEKRKILCKVIHGVIDGPHLRWDDNEIKKWKQGNLSRDNEELIGFQRDYNNKICDITRKCVQSYKKKRVLIFAASVRHSRELALILSVKYNLKAKSVDGSTNPGLRRKIIQDFRDGKIEVLCNYGVLTTGFDVPKIDVVIISRFVGSNALQTQMIGRGQRGQIAGGTDELWLFTSFYPIHGEHPELQLGWEALAQSWKSFPDEIKKFLSVRDFKITQYDPVDKQIIIGKPPLISTKPPIFECGACKHRLESPTVPMVNDFFGTLGDLTALRKSLQAKTFPKNCADCRAMDFAADSKCDFSILFFTSHRYDPIFNIFAKFAIENNSKNTKIYYAGFKKFLDEKFENKLPITYFEHTCKSIRRLSESGLLKINPNFTLTWAKISKPEILKNLIDLSQKSKKFNANLEKIKSNYVEINIQPIDCLHELFKDMRKSLNHIPTRRQFCEKLNGDKQNKTDFISKWHNDYSSFLASMNEIIYDDNILKDEMIDEYFEKCIDVKRNITRDELDQYGAYRIEDYEEVFGSFQQFQKNWSATLKAVLDNYDEKRNHSDEEISEIANDLNKIFRILGRWPNYEELQIHSSVGTFRYVIQMKISDLIYLKNIDTHHIDSLLRLIHEFFKLKEILKITPSQNQFTNLTSATVTADLSKVFDWKYATMVAHLNEDIPSDDEFSVHKQKMKDYVIEQLNEIKSKQNITSEKIFEIIDKPLNFNDELSILIHAWYDEKSELKKQFLV